jgi:hypothetical protein
VLLGLATYGVLPGASQAIAYLLPALLLLLALAARWYPGERALLRRIDARRGRGRRVCEAASRSRQRPRSLLPRGGRLIGSSLAVRPPPPAGVVLI